MKIHEETTALGAFGAVSLVAFSLTIYFGFGLHSIGILFGMVFIAFAWLILSVIWMQSKNRSGRSR